MLKEHATIPILLGKLTNSRDDCYTLTGHLGDTRYLEEIEYKILKSMDGYHSFSQLSEILRIDIFTIIKVYNKYKGPKTVTVLEEWNQVGWCEHCHTYVAGNECAICGSAINKIVFSPPCDPFICFDEEQKFLIDELKKRFDIKLDSHALLLANNCIYSNEFFWEIAYNGSIILKIRFPNYNRESWIFELVNKPNLCSKSILDNKQLEVMIEANSFRQDQLFKQSKAFLCENVKIFPSKPLIYFSSGKESQVMLSLFEKIRIPANVITVITGVEFPEEIEFIKKCKKMFEGNNLFNYYLYEDNGQKIIDELNEKKILSAKEPWCRIDFKRSLKNKGTTDIYMGNDFVACEGSRWYENDFRRRHTKVNFISDYEHQVWLHPIAEWTSLDVWIYILKNKLPIDPVYYKGFQRTTCWMCPIVTPFHMYSSMKHYPELWSTIKDCQLEAFGDDTTRDLPF